MISVYYDGYCAFCQRSVQFIKRWQSGPHFEFISQQSQKALAAQKRYGHAGQLPDSLWLQKDDKLLFKASAALEIAKHLRRPWNLMRVLSFLPITLLDWGYDGIARNRHQIVGPRKHE